MCAIRWPYVRHLFTACMIFIFEDETSVRYSWAFICSLFALHSQGEPFICLPYIHRERYSFVCPIFTGSAINLFAPHSLGVLFICLPHIHWESYSFVCPTFTGRVIHLFAPHSQRELFICLTHNH